MTNIGISHPGVLDLITQDANTIRLVIIEEVPLVDEDALRLQDKLNNYLGYAIDGELLKQYPQSKDKLVCIRIDLHAQPADFIVEFVRRYGEVVSESNVRVELAVQGELVL